ANPLFIGMPPGHPGDFDEAPNLIDSAERHAFTGEIGDWRNQGAPRPLFAADNDQGAMYLYGHAPLDPNQAYGTGWRRGGGEGDDTLITGAGYAFFDSISPPYRALHSQSGMLEFATFPVVDIPEP